MKSPIGIVVLGLALGVAAHVGYFQLRKPPGTTQSGDPLAWMKSELHLTDAQYGNVVALHQRTSPQLRQLAMQVLAMQREMDVFENTRRVEGRVDFVEFAHFVDEFKRVSTACEESTRNLVTQTAAILEPDQRRRYLALVGDARARAGEPARVQ